MSPRKAYVFTLNNYSEDEYANISRICENESRFAIVGKEVGESGTAHLQGYIIFKRSYRFDTIKNRYLPRCHIEVAAGSTDANIRYCSKDGNFREFGTRPTESGRTRDELARRFLEAMHNGRSGLCEFATENPGTWYYSGHNLLRNYLTIQSPVERGDIEVLWLYGEPGVGKSRRAHGMYPRAFVKEPRTKWWSGYHLESEVIIDDFGPLGIDINHLLRWFDRYKCYVESKGGMLPLLASKFVVTSNFSPEACFYENVQLPALRRRIVVERMSLISDVPILMPYQ